MMQAWATIGSLAILMVLAQATTAPAQLQNGLILHYDFEEGSGNMVTDSSGFMSPFNLTIQDPGNTSWGNGFLSVNSPTIITNQTPPDKVYDAVLPTNEIALSAWVRPNSLDLTGPSRVFNISSSVASESPTNRNFQLGIDGEHLEGRLRTDSSSANGSPYAETNVGPLGAVVATELQHYVYTRDASGNSAIYVDGELATDNAMQPGDLMGSWDESYLLALAHEHEDPSADSRAFIGDYHDIALWNRSLSEGEVDALFGMGPMLGEPLEAGDVNDDGMVDLTDYGIIRDNFFNSGAGVGREQGDLDFSGTVDWTDFRQWKTAFQGGLGQTAAVPEPGTATLALVGLMLVLFGCRRKR